MRDLDHSIRFRGGLAATHELYSDGQTHRSLAAAVNAGRIMRVRQGWYLLPDTHPELVAAARVGGALTCLPAARMHGLWTTPTPLLHVTVPNEACRLRNPLDKTVRLGTGGHLVRVHWRKPVDKPGRLILDLSSTLADVIRCESAEIAVATADSALFRGAISMHDWRRLVADAPSTRRSDLELVQPLCESGIESLTLFRLRPFGLPIRCQARIPGVGRVDFLVGSRLVIEVDGANYHTDPERFEADRRRDAILSRLGYRVLRFSYTQVLYRWHEVEAAILASVFRGDHH